MSHAIGTVDEGGWRTNALTLGTGDLAIVIGLILLGQVSHDQSPVADPAGSLEAILPFAIGWIVVAALAGVYRTPEASTPTQAAREAIVTWLAAANVGFLLRGSDLFQGGVPWEFTVVLAGLGLVAITAWRVGYVLFAPGSSTATTER